MSVAAPLRAFLVAAILVGLFAGVRSVRPVQAQMESREGIAMQNEILELRREVQILQQQMAAGAAGGAPTYPTLNGSPGASAANNDAVAQLVARVGNLEEAVRQLRGRVDELANTVQAQGADLSKRIDDLAFQTQQHPHAGGASAAAPLAGTGSAAEPSARAASRPAPAAAEVGPGAATGPVSAQVAQRNPEVALRNAYAAIARRDYAVAEKDTRAVLANRASPRAYEAQFLLAQALLGQHQYSQAAIAYDDAYNRNQKGLYAQELLVGLANSLIAINEKRAACDTLAKLHAQFPNPRGDLHEPIAEAARRAGCK